MEMSLRSSIVALGWVAQIAIWIEYKKKKIFKNKIHDSTKKVIQNLFPFRFNIVYFYQLYYKK